MIFVAILFFCQCSDLEPEWLDDIQKNGELFYLELSEGEEELKLARANAHQVSTNHVRFSEKEAEIITEQGRKQRCGSRAKGTATLKRLAKILRRKRRSTLRKGKDGPASILKNQPGQRHGGRVQQQLKEVCVYLNPKRLSASSVPLFEDGGLLEALLGVIHRPSWDSEGMRQEDRLTVHGLVPNSPAVKCGDILIGDVLVAVDDVDVNSENIERVLSCIPGPTQVRLTLETLIPVSSPGADDALEARRIKGSPPVSQLVRLLWGEDTAELQMSIEHIPHIVMYLSLKLDSASPQDEVTSVAKLYLQRFVLVSILSVHSSSLLLGKHLVHVGYWKENNNLLVIGLPFFSLTFYLHGVIHSAFCAADHVPRLDHFFCLFFQQLIQPSRLREGHTTPPPDLSGTLFLEGLPAVRWLTLPPEIKMEVDTVLSDFESSDFGEMSEDYFGLRRMYVILGSCLFYKSYLIANHLPKEDLLDVSLYCQHYCLLPLASERRVGQLVIWREVFPQQRAATAPGYNTPQGRYFLLIVGLRHFMQCVLLEAGGCASPAVGCPGPDSVYVDQVKATLLQLEVLEGGIEERLSAPAAPCLSCADWFLPASSARERLGSLASPVLSKLAGAVKGSGARGRGLFGERSRKPSPQRSLSDSGSEGQEGSVGGTSRAGLSPRSTPDSGRRFGVRRDSLGSGGSEGSGGSGGLFKSPRSKHPNPFYLGTLKKTLTERETEDMYDTIKLSSGAENTLFHFLLMDSFRGVFIAPTHRELIRNFHHCCLSIRDAFRQSLPHKVSWDAEPEHGVLFQCKPQNWTDQKRPAPTMTYWVIGRMLLEPVPQEFYVCFHDSVPEIPVEMAFKLSFGLSL
uniref:Inturned planar cell polarity effector homolog n=1 Tax=Neogobius melanostomus TaxID=47308 RepID=A0A8C6URD6_9GOBI